jgi:dsDNA-specific endonuclease/ATPase MutS2
MNRKFRIGDKVEVIDEPLSGVVVSVKGNRVTFADDDGFEHTYSAQALIKSEPVIIPPTVVPRPKITGPVKPRPKNPPKSLPVVDLHKEKISGLPPMLSPSEILVYQLQHLENFIATMKRRNVKKFVVIHGIGKGKLKAEAQKMLKRKGYIIYDAPYDKFGYKGAFVAEKT